MTWFTEGQLSHANFLRPCNCPKIHLHPQMQENITYFLFSAPKKTLTASRRLLSWLP